MFFTNLNGRTTEERITNMVYRTPAASSSENGIKVTIDYSLTLEQMIEAGQYHHVERFAGNCDRGVEGKFWRKNVTKTITLELVKIDLMDVRFWEAIADIEKRDYVLAKIEHLLAVGAQLPYLTIRRRIVSGSFFKLGNYRYVPYLSNWDNKLELLLDSFGFEFVAECYLLVVCR